MQEEKNDEIYGIYVGGRSPKYCIDRMMIYKKNPAMDKTTPVTESVRMKVEN